MLPDVDWFRTRVVVLEVITVGFKVGALGVSEVGVREVTL